MGFKDLFIETEKDEPQGYVPGPQDFYEDVEATAPEKDTVDFIGDVYTGNNLNDFTRSIFKVEELANTLPAEMPNDTKRSTVLSIMSTVGLDAESVISDGQLRAHVLDSSSEAVITELSNDIDSANSEIESLKVRIEELQKSNSAKWAQINSIKDIAKCEVARIEQLIQFIKEVPGK